MRTPASVVASPQLETSLEKPEVGAPLSQALPALVVGWKLNLFEGLLTDVKGLCQGLCYLLCYVPASIRLSVPQTSEAAVHLLSGEDGVWNPTRPRGQ